MNTILNVNSDIEFAEKTVTVDGTKHEETILLYKGREISKESVIDGKLLIEVVRNILKV